MLLNSYSYDLLKAWCIKQFNLRQRGGMVTQRIANPSIPVRFRALPPKKILVLVIKKSKLSFLYSSVAQLVEQLTVNQLVAGSSPARGAKKKIKQF